MAMKSYTKYIKLPTILTVDGQDLEFIKETGIAEIDSSGDWLTDAQGDINFVGSTNKEFLLGKDYDDISTELATLRNRFYVDNPNDHRLSDLDDLIDQLDSLEE